jgi:hypothetical protein
MEVLNEGIMQNELNIKGHWWLNLNSSTYAENKSIMQG